MDEGSRKGDVGDVRRSRSLVRICGGKVVVWGGQRVLSLSRTRARIDGFWASSFFSSWVAVFGVLAGVRAW